MRAYSFFSITEEFTYTVNITSHDLYTLPEENSNGEMVEPQSVESDYLVTRFIWDGSLQITTHHTN